MKMSAQSTEYRLVCRAGQQGTRPSVLGQAEVEKYATGHHYSEVASSGWSKTKRLRTQKIKFHRKIDIGSINTTTMKDPMKLAQCISQCKFLNHSITFIQETHIFGQSTTKFDDRELCGWTFINSGLKSKASAGVGIALSPDVKLIDIDDTILDGRILLVRIILHGIKISAFCAYAPTELYADSTKEKIFSTLSLAIQKVKREHPGFKVLVGADMNATIGNDSFGPWSYLGPNNDEYATNDNGTRLLSLSNENNLFIMNSLSLFPSKAIHHHTWHSPTGSQREWIIYLQNGILKSFVPIVVFIVRRPSLLKQTIVSLHCLVPSPQNVNRNNFFLRFLNLLNPIKIFLCYIMTLMFVTVFQINLTIC